MSPEEDIFNLTIPLVAGNGQEMAFVFSRVVADLWIKKDLMVAVQEFIFR